MSEMPINPLRQRIMEDMTVRKRGAATQVSRPLAGHGNGGGSAPVPGAP
jgi:hypothetical protein